MQKICSRKTKKKVRKRRKQEERGRKTMDKRRAARIPGGPGVSLTRLVTMGSISLGSRLVRVMRSAFSVLIRWNTNLM